MIDPAIIRQARADAGITQRAAAQLIGATARTWQDWEGGRRNMPSSKFALFVMLTSKVEPS